MKKDVIFTEEDMNKYLTWEQKQVILYLHSVMEEEKNVREYIKEISNENK